VFLDDPFPPRESIAPAHGEIMADQVGGGTTVSSKHVFWSGLEHAQECPGSTPDGFARTSDHIRGIGRSWAELVGVSYDQSERDSQTKG
jgi:hypothetical protein